MDRYEIVVPRSNGEAVFWPCGQKSAFGAQINMLHRTGNNNCRQTGIIVDVHQSATQITGSSGIIFIALHRKSQLRYQQRFV